MKPEPNLIERLIAAWKNNAPSMNEKPQIDARIGSYGVAYSVSYDGEKNMGEIGPVFDYTLDFNRLRLRSWQSYLENDISQTILNKYVLWMVDEGLKLQANPASIVLKNVGIEFDKEDFNMHVESRFSIWSESTMSSYNGMDNLNSLAQQAYKTAKIGGDVLVIIRLINNVPKIQLIDGAHVQSPMYGTNKGPNKIVHGVEIDETGKHVAYWVRKKDFKTERIDAIGGKSNMVMAFMVYGSKYRVDNHRGMPIIGTCLESLAKIDRYKEAAVGSAEERAKIPYTIEHEEHSTGESPLAGQLAGAFDAGASTTTDIPIDEVGNKLANTVAASMNKMVFNMPKGAKLAALNSTNEMFFRDFYETIAHTICSAIGIPPNVAFSIYNDSFSASRTATKDWEHTMMVERKNFAFQFYSKIYAFWLHVEILLNNIQAPGYLNAFSKGDNIILEAWRKSRFTGAMFPHIDPLKEVNAERAKLGDGSKHMPLTTIERATEILGGGDSTANIEQYAMELKKGSEEGIEKAATPMQPGQQNNDDSKNNDDE